MNGKQAKRIRQEVYGDYSPRFRGYTGVNRQVSDFIAQGRMVNQVGTITADPRRQAYQKAKRDYTRKAANHA